MCVCERERESAHEREREVRPVQDFRQKVQDTEAGRERDTKRHEETEMQGGVPLVGLQTSSNLLVES